MWKAKQWDELTAWETAFWADGPGQSPDRVPEVRRRVHDWVLANYRAEKEEGKPQPLDPPADGRLGDLRVPLLVMLGTLDEPATVESMRHLAASVPTAWRCPVGMGQIHTSFQAGGIPSPRRRASTSGSVMTCPAGSS